jgi:glycosyltransferase involved in cell wall biosynthesis
MSRISIYFNSQYVVEKSKKNDDILITSQELKSWIRSGRFFSKIFRYREAKMLAFDLDLLSKPFASALLIWLLARKKAVREDQKGRSEVITLALLFSLFWRLSIDFFRKRKFLKAMEREIDALSKESASLKHPLDLKKPPIYLRTDFLFGLNSGGSVGHTAGVLNNLSSFTENPIFITTDRLPTIRSEWETHVITSKCAFWDFNELPPLYFNSYFYQKSLDVVGQRVPSFIYQRYSINQFSGLKLAKHAQVPFVLEYNGSEIWVNRHWGKALQYEALAEKIELLNLRCADLIVVISKPLKDTLVEKGIGADKILVNPNGVDPEVYSPMVDGRWIRNQYALEGKIVIGFIGTFGKWHGAEVLASAFAQLLDDYPQYREKISLLLIGNGLTLPEVQKRLKKWESHVIYTGEVPQEEGPLYLAACDLLISPHVPNVDGTPFFGSPTKLFEYMAMGKGIIASDLDQIGEILTHQKTAWMVKPGDTNSLIEGIKVLINQADLRMKLGQNARDEAVSKHSWKQHTQRIIERLLFLETFPKN